MKSLLLKRRAAADPIFDQLNEPAVSVEHEDPDWENPFFAKGNEARYYSKSMQPLPAKCLAHVDIHKTPKKLPPRDDLRRHVDESLLEKPAKEPKVGRHVKDCNCNR